jgi:hypothetical protein
MRLCVITGCVHHVGDCPRDDCECPPAIAAPNSHACAWHEKTTREDLRELPALWEAIAEPTSGFANGGPDDEKGPTYGAPVEARMLIRNQLITWCRILHEEGRCRLPVEAGIAATTRRLVMGYQFDAEVALHAYRDTTDLELRAKHYRAAMHARERANVELARRESGRDILEVLAERIDAHLLWLLGSAHAKIFAEDIMDLWARAKPVAYRGGQAPVTIACLCGARVPIDYSPADPNARITCPGCGEWGDLTWWRKREAPPMDGPLSLKDLVGWLLINHQINVTYDALRNWSRSDRNPRMIPLAPAFRDAGGVLRPALYDPDAALAVVNHQTKRRTIPSGVRPQGSRLGVEAPPWHA